MHPPSNFKGFPFKKLERETNTKMIHYNLEYPNLGFLDEEWLSITKTESLRRKFLSKVLDWGDGTGGSHACSSRRGPELESLALRWCLISALGGRCS